MDHHITNKQPLLNELGHLNEPGFALKEVFEYSRKMIKASKWRIKEWDYYACLNEDFVFAFTVADLGYLGMCTATYLDLTTGKETKKTIMTPFPFGRYGLPETSKKGNFDISKKKYSFKFLLENNKRILDVRIKDFVKGKDLTALLTLEQPKDDIMLIATPWKEKPKAFYYNQKINCMPTSGSVTLGDKEFIYDKEKDFSVLDWGRGVWTYKNTWYWGSMSTLVDGKRFGFNIGYGFGDTSKATENMLFYDGKAHKLNDVEFIINKENFMKPWKFESSDDRLSLVMTPLLDRVDNTNLLIIKNFGHQVFGKFNGFVVLDDGTKLEIIDKLGFAEEIINQY